MSKITRQTTTIEVTISEVILEVIFEETIEVTIIEVITIIVVGAIIVGFSQIPFSKAINGIKIKNVGIAEEKVIWKETVDVHLVLSFQRLKVQMNQKQIKQRI